MNDSLTGLLSLLFVSLLLIACGPRKQPGLGILISLPIAGWRVWMFGGPAELGLAAPASWMDTLIAGLLLGGLIGLLALILVEPAAERLTGRPHDLALVEPLRGNRRALLQWLALVWTLVAFTEEALFRGYWMTEVARLLGNSAPALLVNLLLASLVFGVAHAYQGPSGAISTGAVGSLLAAAFLLGGFNLWLPIIMHGAVDTVGLGAIFLGWDRRLKRLLIKGLPEPERAEAPGDAAPPQ